MPAANKPSSKTRKTQTQGFLDLESVIALYPLTVVLGRESCASRVKYHVWGGENECNFTSNKTDTKDLPGVVLHSLHHFYSEQVESCAKCPGGDIAQLQSAIACGCIYVAVQDRTGFVKLHVQAR